jgi:hypothetical protein
MIMIDMIEPVQLEKEYLVAFRQNSIPSSIRTLVEAIMDQALQDIVNDEGRDAAVYWISTDNFSYPFSFRSICEMLGMNPYTIRNAVQRFVTRQKRLLSRQQPSLSCLN